MPSLRVPLHSYTLDSSPASSSRLVNCYVEQLPPDAKTPMRLVRCPGIKTWTTVPYSSGIMGMQPAHDGVYVFSALPETTYTFYIKSDLSTDTQYAAPVTSGFVDIASNANSVVLVSAHGEGAERQAFYITNAGLPSAVYGYISDADFLSRGATQVEFLDNWILFLEPDSGRFFGADLGSVTAFDALNFATAESHPDRAVAMIADHGQLFILGEESGELWVNAGIQGFPFQRVPNGRVQIGCIAPLSVARLDQSVAWLASDLTVRMLQGITPQRISTHAVEERIKQVSSITGSKGYSYTYNGHAFYVLTTDTHTFVYDATTQLWHERQTYGLPNWLPAFHSHSFGKVLTARPGNPVIGEVDSETYTEFGETQVMSWTYQPVYAQGKNAFHDRLEVVMETGVGDNATTDPQIVLEISDDGGQSFAHFETKSIGAKGNRNTRVMWHGLGSSDNRVYRMSVSDPVKIVVTDTILEARGARL